MNRRVVRVLGCALVLSAIVGCAGAPTSTAPPASVEVIPTGSPTAAPTASPTVESPSAAPSAGTAASSLCAINPEPCRVAAGTYSSAPFEHPFTFTISGDDWLNDRDWPHGGSVTKAGVNAFLWASKVTVGRIGETDTPIGPTPQDFIDFLGKNDAFTVSEAVPVTVDGLSGLQADLVANEAARGVFTFPEDQFNLVAGEKTRFLALDKDGATVILIVESFKTDTFDAFMSDVAQPILDGLTWE